MEMKFTDGNFENDVMKSQKLVVVDFYADWCGPCKMMAPVIEELAKEYDGEVIIGKLNVDENQKTAMNFNVMSIPTIIYFKNGQIVEKFVGARSKSELETKIQQHK